jgi:hypothetical protein
MNCKQGDMAFVVNDIDFPENDGALVEVKRRPITEEGWFGGITPGDWVCVTLSTSYGWANDECTVKAINDLGDEILFNDSCLRPIRPSEGQDETLSWKDVPQGEYA